MSTHPRRRPALAVAGLLAVLSLLVGCGGYEETTVPPAKAQPAASEAPVTTKPCKDDGSQLASYSPSDDTDGPAVSRIRSRGRLIVGVSADQLQMGSRNPQTGRIEGFDIDMAGYVAREIFGSSYDPGKNLDLKVITPADRIPFLQDGQVDIVARNMTINCARWQQIAFSQQYYASGQRILVAADSDATGIKDLAGLRVCAPEDTTSLENLEREAPDATPVVVTNDTDCLLAFQNSQADAITTDDTVLAGLAAQDPNAKVISDGDPLSDEPYGIGVNSEDVDLVRLINATLEKIRDDGDWQRSYDTWLKKPLNGARGEQPQGVYGR